MAGFDNNVMYADNVDFTGSADPSAKMTANGQLIIGKTGSNPQINTLTAGTGINITNGPGTISISTISNPSQAFLAYLGTDDTNATGDQTQYTIGTIHPLTIVTNIGGNLNANGTYTVPTFGLYIFNVNIRYANLSPAHTTGYVVLKINGVTQYNVGGLNPYATQSVFASAGFNLNGTLTLLLNAGDQVVMQAYVANGTKTVTIVSGIATSFNTYFSGARLS